MWILDLLFGDPVTPEWLTVTLPITLTGAKVLLAMLGLILSSGLVWLMLNAPDRAERQRDLLTDALTALGWVLLPFWFLLLAGTLWHLWLLFSGLDSFLDNVGFGMGAVVAAFLGGPFVIWGAVLKHRTVEFQKEGHITERISKAVEQLGAEKSVSRVMRNVTYEESGKTRTIFEGRLEDSDLPVHPDEADYGPWEVVQRTVPNIEVRIGGLLSLERIAQDSTRYDKGRDHVRVMEILCAYVRENAKAPSLAPDNDQDGPFFPRSDVQMAIDVIKRRADAQVAIETSQKYRLDLRRTDFRGTDLSRGRFRGALLAECRFEFSRMRGADFSGAVFDRSVLSYVDGGLVKFIGASMNFCRIDKPEPTIGGFAINFSLGDITGLSLVASNITALDYIGDGSQPTFGTKDTQLEEELDEQRSHGIKTVQHISKLECIGKHEGAATLRKEI